MSPRLGVHDALWRAGRWRTAWARCLGSQCAVCEGWGAGALCTACTAQARCAGPRCPRCALQAPSGLSPTGSDSACTACITEPPPWEQAVAAVDYVFPWNRLVTAFKRAPQPALADPLAHLLSTAVRAAVDAGQAPPPDLVVPIPLALPRLRGRGFNPAWELARRVADDLGHPAAAEALFRVRDTRSQAGLNRTERQANMRNAFAVASEGMARLRGRRVALVDDVLTTGATAAAATRALLQGGAAQVQLWAVARTPAKGAP